MANKYKFFKVVFCFNLYLFSFTAFSDDQSTNQPSKCQKWFIQSIQATHQFLQNSNDYIKSYLSELKASRGMRLLLKKAKENDSSNEADQSATQYLWGGLLVHQNRTLTDRASTSENLNSLSILNQWGRLMPNPGLWMAKLIGKRDYIFSPVHFFHYNSIDRPISFLAKRFFQKNLKPTLLTTILLSSFYTTPFVIAFDALAIKNHEHFQLQMEYLIQNDYRFHDILDLRNSKKINKEEAIQAATLMKIAWENFWNRFTTTSPQNLIQEDIERVEKGYPIYSHLQELFRQGVLPKPGSHHGERGLGPLNFEEKKDLLFYTYYSFAKSALAVDWVLDRSQLIKNVPDWINKELANMTSDLFLQDIKTRIKNGQLTKNQGLRIIQEDIDNQLIFSINERLNIFFLIEETGEQITLDRLRQEMLSDLNLNK